MPYDQLAIDALWDFEDAAGSEFRFRDAAPHPEITTQIARAQGLHGDFAGANATLDEITDTAPATLARIELERGRILNSSGDREASVKHFEAAAATAAEAGLDFLQIDAHHMLAIADGERAVEHTDRALAILASTDDERAKVWEVSLRNNLGWVLDVTGDSTAALAQFRLALDAAERVGTDEQRRWAVETIVEYVEDHPEASGPGGVATSGSGPRAM